MNPCPLIVLLMACGPQSTEPQQARRYVDALAPLLADNGLLADILWESADVIYGGQGAHVATLRQWTEDIAPLAGHLHDQAALIEPPTDWAPAHAELVAAWGGRATSYRDIGEART